MKAIGFAVGAFVFAIVFLVILVIGVTRRLRGRPLVDRDADREP